MGILASDSWGFNTLHHLRGVTGHNKDAFKSNGSGLKFNDPETVRLFVRGDWHIPAVPRSHYKLIYAPNTDVTNTLVKKMNKDISNKAQV